MAELLLSKQGIENKVAAGKLQRAHDARFDRRKYHVTVIGSGGVGKSCITVVFIQGTFLERYDPTIEDDYSKDLEWNGVSCHVDVTDTAGQEEYRALGDQAMKRADAALLVYSVVSQASFDVLPKFIAKVKTVRQGMPIVLVGNKVDLRKGKGEGSEVPQTDYEDDEYITMQQGEKLAKEFDIPFLETSAKKNQGVIEAFMTALREIDEWRLVNWPKGGRKGKKKGKCALF